MALKDWKKSKTGNRFVNSKNGRVLLVQNISERGIKACFTKVIGPCGIF